MTDEQIKWMFNEAGHGTDRIVLFGVLAELTGKSVEDIDKSFKRISKDVRRVVYGIRSEG